MITNSQAAAFEKRIAEIEKRIEEENERANLNRMKARFFMFFLLIGADDETRGMLERKVRDLLRNPDACAFLQIDGETSTETYGEEFEKVLLCAANKHVDVQNLNNVFMCPVLFAGNDDDIDAVGVLTSIDSFIKHSGKLPIWQPFVVIHRSVSQYGSIYSAIMKMQEFIRTDTGGEYIHRCCILSDQDGNGFTVTKENIMQTIAMTVALQNIENQSVGASKSIVNTVKIDSNSVGGSTLFFTARNAAVTNPIRSLTFERMRSAIDYFSGSIDASSEEAISRIDYSFVRNIINPYLEKLPRINGKITFFPLYAVMSTAELQKNLQEVAKKYYVEPLLGASARAERLESARRELLGRFFEANGSLATLRELVAEKKLSTAFSQYSKNSLGTLPIEDPLPNKPKLKAFNEGIYLQARRYCEDVVCKAGLSLLDDLSADLCSAEMLASITAAEDTLHCAKDAIADRIRTLRDVETVLVLDRTVRKTDFGSVQNGWIADEADRNPRLYRECNKRFDYMIYSMLTGKTFEDVGEILDVCYRAVSSSGYSNIEYLKRLSEECQVNEDRANEFSSVVEKSWCYTLRLLKYDENSDTTCIIGDPTNSFCRVLENKFRASLFAFEGFDRIDVLHVSAPFPPDNIWEWEQIKQRREQE